MRKQVIAVVGAILWVACAAAQQAINETKPAAKDGVVEVSNVAGSVRITGWDKQAVEVTGTLGRGTERLDFTSSGNRTLVKVVLPHSSHHTEGSDLVIHVPAGSRVEAETVSAELAVADVTGALDLESVSGEVTARGNPHEVEASSVSGDVEVYASSAPVRAKSVSGEVRVKGARGTLEATSVSGRVVVQGEELHRAELETTSGSIRLDASLASDCRLDAKTVSGTIELTLPRSTAADFTVTSFSGDIDNELGPPAHRTSEYGPGRELEFSTGAGGARVTVKAFSGDVRLRARP